MRTHTKFSLKILSLLRAYNYALEETIRLMDNLVGCPKEDIEDKIGMVFSLPLRFNIT